MSKSTIVLLAGLLNFSFAFGQDYRRGFILKINGDTVKGFVKYGSRKSKSRVCYFKADKRVDRIVYTAEEIKGYGYDNSNSYEAQNISKKEKKFRFLEVLVKGTVSLYRNLDLFYLEKDSLFALSKAPQSVSIIDGRQYNSTTSKYVGVLNYVLSDCNLKADKVRYQEKSMTILIQKYNLCKGELGLTDKTKRPWTKASGMILSGIDQSIVNLDGLPGSYSFNKSLSVPVGLGMDLSSPRWSDKTHFTIEMWYDKKLYQGYRESTTSGSINRTDVIINVSYMKMPLGIQFNLMQEQNTPYFKLGYVQYVLLNTSGTVRSEIERAGIVSTNLSDVSMDKKNTNGFWLGAGYRRRSFPDILDLLSFDTKKITGFRLQAFLPKPQEMQ